MRHICNIRRGGTGMVGDLYEGREMLVQEIPVCFSDEVVLHLDSVMEHFPNEFYEWLRTRKP